MFRAMRNGVPAPFGGEPHGPRRGIVRQVHRLGAYLCAHDRLYRVTLQRAERRIARNHEAFREWAACIVLGFAAQAVAIGGGVWYFWAAEQEYQRIVQQRQQQEQRQRELDRQSYFVRIETDNIVYGEWP